MAKFVNQVGSLDNPRFLELIVQGLLSPAGQVAEVCFNVFHFRRKTVGGVLNLANAYSAIWSAMVGPWEAAVVAAYTTGLRTIRAMDDPTSLGHDETADVPGINAGELYASDTAVYMQLKTGFRGRSFMGAKHFGGSAEVDIDQGYLDASGITLWDALRDVLTTFGTTGVTDTDGNTWFLIVLSQVLSDLVANPSVFTGADVSEVLVNKRIGTMGKRRGNRAEI